MEHVHVKQPTYGSLVSQETINWIVLEIVRRFAPEQVVLFGSYATGNPTPDSDLDLFVVMQTDLPRHKRSTQIRLLFRPAPCPMDILVYTPEEVGYWSGVVNHIVADVMEQGKILYERSQEGLRASVV